MHWYGRLVKAFTEEDLRSQMTEEQLRPETPQERRKRLREKLVPPPEKSFAEEHYGLPAPGEEMPPSGQMETMIEEPQAGQIQGPDIDDRTKRKLRWLRRKRHST